MLPIVALIVWMGVAPNTFLARTQGSLDALTSRLDRARAQKTALLELERGNQPRVADASEDGTR